MVQIYRSDANVGICDFDNVFLDASDWNLTPAQYISHRSNNHFKVNNNDTT